MAATLRLTREATGIELRRGTFEIRVDGETAGTIERHDVVEVPLEPGHHTIRLTAGRYSSRDHAFDVADDETANLRCHGAMLWPRYVASLLKSDLAISIKHE